MRTFHDELLRIASCRTAARQGLSLSFGHQDLDCRITVDKDMSCSPSRGLCRNVCHTLRLRAMERTTKNTRPVKDRKTDINII